MADVFFAKIIETTSLLGDVFSVTISCKELADGAKAGQFVHIKCGSRLLLRRPISICDIYQDRVRIVFEIKGDGTKWLSERLPGELLDVLGPLGNGFSLPDGPFIVVGGGIGTPPMLYAARCAGSGDVTAVLGFRTASRIILQNEFSQLCRDVIVTTDDGSAGIHSAVIGPLEKLLAEGGHAAVLSCGPYNMQKAVAALCASCDVPCLVSLEERMGCGVGACLVCACKTKFNDAPGMSRVCADGPVFDASNVVW